MKENMGLERASGFESANDMLGRPEAIGQHHHTKLTPPNLGGPVVLAVNL
jgi:hypothetical protein